MDARIDLTAANPGLKRAIMEVPLSSFSERMDGMVEGGG